MATTEDSVANAHIQNLPPAILRFRITDPYVGHAG